MRPPRRRMRQQIHPATARVAGPASSADGSGAMVVLVGVVDGCCIVGNCGWGWEARSILSKEGSRLVVICEGAALAGPVVGAAATGRTRTDPDSAIAPATVACQLNMPCSNSFY